MPIQTRNSNWWILIKVDTVYPPHLTHALGTAIIFHNIIIMHAYSTGLSKVIVVVVFEDRMRSPINDHVESNHGLFWVGNNLWRKTKWTWILKAMHRKCHCVMCLHDDWSYINSWFIITIVHSCALCGFLAISVLFPCIYRDSNSLN